MYSSVSDEHVCVASSKDSVAFLAPLDDMSKSDLYCVLLTLIQPLSKMLMNDAMNGHRTAPAPAFDVSQSVIALFISSKDDVIRHLSVLV